MSLNQNHIVYLKNRAARGDLDAQAILEAMLTEQVLGEPKVVTLLDVAAKSATNIAASSRGDAATNPITIAAGAAAALSAAPRNVRATFGSTWDGGDITITGTDQFDKAQTTVLTAVAGQIVVGTKVFKTITSIAKAAVGTDATGNNTVTLGTGDKLACGTAKLTQPFGECRLGTGAADAVIFDVAASAFTPTTVPDGSLDYSLLVHTEAIYND